MIMYFEIIYNIRLVVFFLRSKMVRHSISSLINAITTIHMNIVIKIKIGTTLPKFVTQKGTFQPVLQFQSQ